jgi:exosortase B
MSTVLEERNPTAAASRRWLGVALPLAGLAAVYVPTFVDLARGAWREEAHAHGPLVLLVSAALLWRGRAALDGRAGRAPLAGGGLALFGLALWLLGRTQSLVLFEAGSLLPVAAGLVLMAGGLAALRRLAFPLAFLAFYVPLPGFIVDGATAPLKEMVSGSVAQVLAAFGYAVERSGVVLAVGGRELLVADACSGLNSLVSLLAMGLLYGHLRRARPARMALLAAAVVPIAIAANVARVLALVLITVHAGPEAAQGWVHDALGLSVFVLALLMLLALDRLTPGTGAGQALGTRETSSPVPHLSQVPAPYLSPVLVSVVMVMVGAAVAAPALRPVADPGAAFDLEAAVPVAFAGWRVDPQQLPVMPAPEVQANLARLYRQVLGRTYVNDAGESMMLTVAHGGDQSDALKAHRQEVCYRAQGFQVSSVARGSLSAGPRRIPVTRFNAVRGERSEPVTYWFTMGDRVVIGRLERLREQLAYGLRGRVPDGLLVRVSSIDADPARAHAAQRAFIASLLASASPGSAARLAGSITSR